MKKNKMLMGAAVCSLLLLASCGTSKMAQGSATKGKPVASKETKATGAQESEAVKKLTFVQKVSDNQVYAKNIVGNMSFNLQMGGKDITVPGSLHMRKDEVIRIQLFIPILGTEVGRLEFTPNYVLIIDRLHKEYIKADYTQVDFLKKQGINFYSLQALFWNQLLVPGVQKVSESDLKKFDANLDETGENVPISIKYGNMSYTWKASRSSGRITEANVMYKDSRSGASTANIQYANFKNVGVKLFPASQHLTLSATVDGKHREIKMNMEMNDVKTDSNWNAQSEISSKYKQVSPEDVLGKLMNM